MSLLSFWTSFCHLEPHSVILNEVKDLHTHFFWGVVSGRKGVQKRPVTTWNHSICILSCSVRAENSIKRPGHNMEKWKSRQHTAIVTLITDSSLRSEWQYSFHRYRFFASLRMTKSRSRLRSEWQNKDVSTTFIQNDRIKMSRLCLTWQV